MCIRDRDDVVTFEELGIDRLFIDDAHNFKNLFLYTKLRNVAGVAQTEAKKSSDLFAKCQYLEELTGGRGVVFATGPPISNSLAELYTMMRYLQYGMLQDRGCLLYTSRRPSRCRTRTAISGVSNTCLTSGKRSRCRARRSCFFLCLYVGFFGRYYVLVHNIPCNWVKHTM